MSAEFSSTGLYLQLLRKTAAGRVVSVTQQPGLVHFKFRTSLLLPQCVLSALIDSAAAEQQPAQCCSAADSSSADSLPMMMEISECMIGKLVIQFIANLCSDNSNDNNTKLIILGI